MLAIQLSAFGTPDVLKTAEVPVPELTPSQVLVQNHAVAIDPYDVKFAAGLMGDKPLPLIPGSSVVGEIVAVGDKVTDFEIGDRVAATRYLKGYASFVPVHQKNLAKVPDNLSDEVAVAAVLGAATGFEMITSVLDVQANQNILITGAAGAVGTTAAQIAKLRGANVYALVRPNQMERMAELNVSVVTDDNVPDIIFDGVLNTINDNDLAQQLIQRLSPQGQFISLTPLPEDITASDNVSEVFASGTGNHLSALFTHMSDGDITINIADVMPFNEKNLQAAHRIMLEDHPQGKLVLTF
ncbi:zinc-binding oxidoreductase [Weissella ceti NC36]|uniref:NADP-dependent oxidoreductase n=1 Tax=Weissella ceti TaxID=759620 RepID=UPI0002AAACA4|nr:NADP-dependent oxidoreductase [Weissella ceti]ELA07522.1 zinc-binding oxidoreductase [Weissella ceti NC36]